MRQSVIDVSKHNGVIDWEQVKAAGVHAIIRCGYGSDTPSQDDAQWARNSSECERLGIPYGVYLYSYAKTVDEARSEARHALRLVQGKKLSYPIYFDAEEHGTESVARATATAFCEAIEAAGYKAGIYTATSWWRTHLKGVDRWTKWVAHWGVNSPGVTGDMWQYGGTTCPGVTGEVDGNWCYRDFPAELSAKPDSKSSIGVHLQHGSQDDRQKWRLVDEGGRFRLMNVKSGYCLDVANGAAEHRTPVRVHRPNGTKAQLWDIDVQDRVRDKWFYLRSALDRSLVLACVGGGKVPGTGVVVGRFDASTAQRWELVWAGSDSTYYIENVGTGLRLAAD